MTTTRDIELDHTDTAVRPGVGKPRAATVLTATVGALIIWVLAAPVGGADLTVGAGAGARTVGSASVAVASVVAGLAAIGLAAVLTRVTRRPRRTWRLVAGVTLVLSLAGPLGAATVGGGAVLVAMHVIVGATLVVGVGGTIDLDGRART